VLSKLKVGGRPPFDGVLCRTVQAKAANVGARVFFTWNVNPDLLDWSRLVMVTKRLAVAMLAALALGAAGCLPLMVGSLGYEGYEYHETGTLPGMPPSQSSSSSSSTAKQAAHQTPSPDDIE
jgi:hypothetical protein